MVNKTIYLDHAATTYVKPEVFDAMKPYFCEHFGNASSIYSIGRESKKAVEEAREKVAKAIGAQPREIYFTGSGSEADNWALKGIAAAYKKKGNHIITSLIEHPAILNTCKYLEGEGFEVTYLPVDEDGLIAVEDVRNSIKESTILISIMFANNEIGTIQQIEEIGAIAREKGVLFHTDAVQAVGDQLRPQPQREDYARAPGRRADGCRQQPRLRGKEARGYPQDGRVQQGLRALPLVI